MSNLATANGDDFPDAASKHLDDATVLVNEGRHDGGGYLAGYVVECSLKAMILLEEVAKVANLGPTTLASVTRAGGPAVAKGLTDGWKRAKSFGHQLHELSTEVTRLAALPGAVTAAYGLPPGPSTMSPPTAPAWSETLRYRRSGCIDATTSRRWLDEAADVHARTVARMRRDGVIY